jgi:putative ABC transport system permease protein
VLSFVWRDLVRNPHRTVASLAGVVLGVGLFSGVLFFIDGSLATMTQRALAPLSLDMQRVLATPLGPQLRLEERLAGLGPLRAGEEVRAVLTVTNTGSEPANEVVVSDEPRAPLAHVRDSTTIEGRRLRDREGGSPLAQGVAGTGLNIGTVPPRRAVTLTYRVRARRPVADVRAPGR